LNRVTDAAPRLDLDLLPGLLAIAKLAPVAEVPSWALGHGFSSVTRTEDELSIVCPQAAVPDEVVVERGYRCFKVRGPLDFSEIGVLASLAQPLAEAGVSIFVLSTFETDYLLVQERQLSAARDVLLASGHVVHE
jgi:hypothetical protein